jgi:hypothetical protein
LTKKRKEKEVERLDTYAHPMCCVTLQRRALSELLYVPRPSFLIPIFRAPITSSTTIRTTISTVETTTNKILSNILKQERRQVDIASTLPSSMINQRIFENLVLTNTIVAAFCIVLMVTITGFLIFLLIPSIRRRWLNEQPRDERKLEDVSTLSRQQSFHHFTLGPSRLNPLFEPTPGTTTTTTTQFGTLFQPHGTTATLLHPTIWTPMTPASLVSTPIPSQQPQISSTPPAPMKPRPTTTTTTASGRPPLPSHPPTTIQRSPRKR